MRNTPGRTFVPAKPCAAPAELNRISDPIGLGSAITSGLIREQDVITVLTEMCQCLLVARRKRSEKASTEAMKLDGRADSRKNVSD